MITLRARHEHDDPRIVAILNTCFPGLHMTMERYRYELAHSTHLPKGYVERHVAEAHGTIAGVMSLERHSWLSRPGSYFADIAVDPPFRGHGIGSRLHELLETRARAIGADRVYGEFFENVEEARRFVQARGYAPTGRVDRMSRLPVARATLAGYEDLEERLAAADIRVRSIAELGLDDEFLRQVQLMEHETARDLPSAEEQGEPSPFETWREDKLFSPGRTPEMFFVAIHGDQPVGLARLHQRSTKVLNNGYTGVDRAHRGRGVARLLKLKTIQWAQRQGCEWIYTGNDVENERMLAINIRLGYEPLPGLVLVVMELRPHV
jgi:GNAT superfamily N-acetyltransferase